MQLLFLAYYFPPLGGAGTQRSLKFTKYLPEFGIQPTMISGGGVTGDRWQPPDDRLGGEVREAIEVHRVAVGQGRIPASVQKLGQDWLGIQAGFGRQWRAGAQSHGRRLRQEQRFDVILATMSPFSSADAAATLSRELGIPWVADLRDPWALDEWQVHPTRWHRRGLERKMERTLRSASLIIMNTPEAAKRCRAAFPSLSEVPITSLTNGYDAEDFPPLSGLPRNSKFTIVHAGALHVSGGLKQRRRARLYQALGRTQPGVRTLARSHYFLVQALERWIREEPGILNSLDLHLVGAETPEDRALVDASPVREVTRFTGYLNHSESVGTVRGADLLFLPMHRMPPGHRATIVPGKTYEYMASGRPILAAVPEGDARDFLRQAGTASICEPENVEDMLRILRERFAAWQEDRELPPLDLGFCQRFERRELSRQLAAQLSAVAEGRAMVDA